MQVNALKVSEDFRKVATRAILSIVMFLFTYILMIILGLGVIVLCGWLALLLLQFHVSFITGALGLGLVGMGIMIFFFLIKFIFSSGTKVDRSHLTEITAVQQPELFKMLKELVDEVQTDFPKKVYLSSEVNAAVFYDSTFWSMFFPVRKNLQIGVGLMNTVSVIELKAILAHEFGHFSQRSMKVGSYVYNVNKVIHNMLFDNEGYDMILSKWGNSSSYFMLFASAALLVIKGIQRVLAKVYKSVNLNYMALSREMEFHADAVAAHIAGSAALANSLLRLDLASQSLSHVFNYYEGKIASAEKTNNFFPQQSFVLDKIATLEQLPIVNGLPVLSVEDYRKFNRTKLVLSEQWSSHPSTEERVARLLALGIAPKGEVGGLAIQLLSNQSDVLEEVSRKLFEGIKYSEEPSIQGLTDFVDDYVKNETDNAYPAVFNGYFDSRDPKLGISTDESIFASITTLHFNELINDETIARLNELTVAINDKHTLEQIANGVIEVDTFDYDGIKYVPANVTMLIEKLEQEILETTAFFDQLDQQLFLFFSNIANSQNASEELQKVTEPYSYISSKIDELREVYDNVNAAADFMRTSTPIEDIPWMIERLKKAEVPFKEAIVKMLAEDSSSRLVDTDSKAIFDEYLAKNYSYFGYDIYFQAEVDSLFLVIYHLSQLLIKEHRIQKKIVLSYYSELLESASAVQSA